MTGLNLHEFKNEKLLDYKSDFELNGLMDVGPVKRQPNIRFRSMDDFGSYINAIDFAYDSGDVAFTGYVCKLNTTQLKIGKQSAYAKGTIYMQEIVECHRQDF